MARCKLHLGDGMALEAIGRTEEVLNETKQVLATAQLCVERVILEDGDDGTLRQVSQTLDLWRRASGRLWYE